MSAELASFPYGVDILAFVLLVSRWEEAHPRAVPARELAPQASSKRRCACELAPQAGSYRLTRASVHAAGLVSVSTSFVLGLPRWERTVPARELAWQAVPCVYPRLRSRAAGSPTYTRVLTLCRLWPHPFTPITARACWSSTTSGAGARLALLPHAHCILPGSLRRRLVRAATLASMRRRLARTASCVCALTLQVVEIPNRTLGLGGGEEQGGRAVRRRWFRLTGGFD